MKRPRYTEKQIAFALKRAGHTGSGSLQQQGHLGRDLLRLAEEIRQCVAMELRRLKGLEEADQRLKRSAADLSLDKAMLQDVLPKGI